MLMIAFTFFPTDLAVITTREKWLLDILPPVVFKFTRKRNPFVRRACALDSLCVPRALASEHRERFTRFDSLFACTIAITTGNPTLQVKHHACTRARTLLLSITVKCQNSWIFVSVLSQFLFLICFLVLI